MDRQNEQGVRRDILVALRYSYDEADWVTPLSEALEGVTIQEALWNPDPSDPDARCLWEIVSHLTVWAENIVERRAQRQNGAPPGRPSKGAWPSLPTVCDDAAWSAAQQRLWDSEKALRNFVENVSFAEMIDEGNVGYSQLGDLLCRFTHNAYHLGQITKLRQWYKAVQSKNT